jgi:hypothetical protein
MDQDEQAKNHAGRHDIGFHERAPDEGWHEAAVPRSAFTLADEY